MLGLILAIFSLFSLKTLLSLSLILLGIYLKFYCAFKRVLSKGNKFPPPPPKKKKKNNLKSNIFM